MRALMTTVRACRPMDRKTMSGCSAGPYLIASRPWVWFRACVNMGKRLRNLTPGSTVSTPPSPFSCLNEMTIESSMDRSANPGDPAVNERAGAIDGSFPCAHVDGEP